MAEIVPKTDTIKQINLRALLLMAEIESNRGLMDYLLQPEEEFFVED
jgi:hypothetical protein